MSVAQKGKDQTCPTVSVSCADLLPGKSLSYKANVDGGDASVKPAYAWKVSGGKITGGQGTAEVAVEPERGLPTS